MKRLLLPLLVALALPTAVNAELRSSLKLNNIRGFGLYNYTQTIWNTKNPNTKITIDYLVDCEAEQIATFNVQLGGIQVKDISTNKELSKVCKSEGY